MRTLTSQDAAVAFQVLLSVALFAIGFLNAKIIYDTGHAVFPSNAAFESTWQMNSSSEHSLEAQGCTAIELYVPKAERPSRSRWVHWRCPSEVGQQTAADQPVTTEPPARNGQ